MSTLAAVVAIIVAIVAPLGTYLITVRKFSGKIQTTDAQQLWKEANQMRDYLRHQMGDGVERITALEARVASLEYRNNELMQHNIELTRQANEYKNTIETQRQRIATLEHQVFELQERVHELQDKESAGKGLA